jgi:hypothetical protein
MAERGFRLGGWQGFAALSVLAGAVVALLILTAPPPPPDARSGQRRPGEPRSEADSVAYLDSLEDAAERSLLRETMSLVEVASRAAVPVDSLAAELRLPATVSRTDPLRALLPAYHLTLQDVRDARRRVQRRMGVAFP